MEEARGTVIVRSRGDRMAIRRPIWIALQVERIGDNPRIRAVGLHHVQERPAVLAGPGIDAASIGRDGWATQNLRALTAPQLCAGSVSDLPNTLGGAGGRSVQKII